MQKLFLLSPKLAPKLLIRFKCGFILLQVRQECKFQAYNFFFKNKPQTQILSKTC